MYYTSSCTINDLLNATDSCTIQRVMAKKRKLYWLAVFRYKLKMNHYKYIYIYNIITNTDLNKIRRTLTNVIS